MNESNIAEIKVLKDDALIKIEIPTNIYERLQLLLYTGIGFQDMEALQKTLHTITNSDEDPDTNTYHIRTLLWLIGNIEEAADKQNCLISKKINTVTREIINEG
jgi:hypothetical protein